MEMHKAHKLVLAQMRIHDELQNVHKMLREALERMETDPTEANSRAIQVIADRGIRMMAKDDDIHKELLAFKLGELAGLVPTRKTPPFERDN
jgi:hypothetical protein